MNDRHQGTVKWFNSTKGFGFIVPDNKELNNGSDVFVHANDLEKSGLSSLSDGQRVSFKIEEYNGKTKAAFVQSEG